MIKICMVGTGYVGLVSGACMADFGHRVTCVDINPERIENLHKGIMPIYEPGLDRLVEKNTSEGRLQFTTSLAEGLEDADVAFIAVQTPMSESGEADLQYVLQVGQQIGELMDHYMVIVTKSTVPVGTNRMLRDVITKAQKTPVEFDQASNPEFLREGSSIEDFMRPDRVVIGVETDRAEKLMREIYRPLYLLDTPMVRTGIETAELIKYASNAFLAVKISFINEIATLAEAVGADVFDVARGHGPGQAHRAEVPACGSGLRRQLPAQGHQRHHPHRRRGGHAHGDGRIGHLRERRTAPAAPWPRPSA